MSSIESVARSALAAVDCDVNWLLACQWAAERYRELASHIRFRHLRELGRVTVPAVIEAGTATVTRGSASVTGDATAQAAWTSDVVGRFFRARANWYRIKSVVASALQLDQQFSEDSVSAASYKIVARQIALDANARWIGDKVVHPRMRRPLDGPLSQVELDYAAPDRQLVGSPPTVWSQTQDVVNAAGQKCIAIEVYPYPTQAELLYYIFWPAPPTLMRSDEVPRVIDDQQLKEGTLIDVMRHNASRAATTGKMEEAAYWRNEYRQQMTTWRDIIRDIGKQDKGVDDLTFILQLTRSQGGEGGDIRTAREEIWARGNRP